jgi:16S rRNA (cytosine1402-N4)-methyltransferase
VLLREVVRALELEPGLVVVDGTVGAGGHSAAILPLIRPAGRIIGLDRDPMMLAFASQKIDGDDVQLVHDSYADLRRVLDDLRLTNVDRILLDLGLSSDQLADRERGFSFDANGPLDLRFDTLSGAPATRWLADASLAEMIAAFREFGEEPFADRIAESIVATRKTKPIATAGELSALILEAVPHTARRGTSHPATRVFQTLRIVANDELGHLDRMLRATLPECLAPGGIAAIISFHSLEDRMVKNAFRNEGLWEQPAAKAVAPTPSEVRFNPRSRSAKLRVARRR